MNQPTPTFYKVVDTPVDSMDEEQLNKEADDLKREITTIETRMGEKKAWAAVEGKSEDHLKWLARSKNFYAKLMVRYTVVRAALRRLNRGKNKPA